MRHLSLLALLTVSCNGGDVEPTPFEALEVDETWLIHSLTCSAEVIRTEGYVPHVYAHDRVDGARVLGFVMARDRYFEMDLASRLGLGTVAQLLGNDALETDMESRSNGMTYVADQLLENMTPEHEAIFDAMSEGVNAYLTEVQRGNLPPPSELELAAGLLGAESAVALMTPFDRRRVAGVMATLVYELGFETGDVGRARTADRLLDVYEDGAALEDLRESGAVEDLWNQVAPVFPEASAPGFGTNRGASGPPGPAAMRLPEASAVPVEMLERLDERLERLQVRLGHDWKNSFGSNAWAVSGSATADGRALLAGDGHLPLSVPSLFWQMGLDTKVLGGGDIEQLGLAIPGLPIMAVGTNGHVAWSQTQIVGDITDWYSEELQLDDDGAPMATLFQGSWEPVAGHEESFTVADVPLLESVGRTETWTRYTTFDGRWLADIEGERVSDDHSPGAGETVVMFGGDFVVPSDTNGDGVISAISFDYAGFESSSMVRALDGFGQSRDIEEFREATKSLVAYSQNMVAADSSGNSFYTGYQAIPCRGYLPRNSDGTWVEGANPALLIDGTTYGGFTIPVTDGKVDESFADDPAKCLVPFEEYPQNINPDEGYVISANHDPGGITLDNDIMNDPWYIGGPWAAGYRANSIARELDQSVASGTADIADMSRIQGDTRSRMGEQFLDDMLESLVLARDAAALDFVEPGSTEERLAELYHQDSEGIEEAITRLTAWAAQEHPTPSGVQTFYNSPDAQQIQDAVATMVFNAWFPRYLNAVIRDENLPDVWDPWSSTGYTRALTRFHDGRGADNPLDLASWNPDTQETAFFDVLGTEPVETSHEVATAAMVDALAWLRSEDGFASEDMDTWLWGLKHTTHFDSILGDFLGNDGPYAAITAQFSINQHVLPIDEGIQRGDPRFDLDGYPRQGDQFSVDAANPGYSGTRFSHGSGPVFRMVIALGPDGDVSGVNVIPGGQSSITTSEFFADQSALWLANDTLPMRYALQDVLDNSIARERFVPSGSGKECP